MVAPSAPAFTKFFNPVLDALRELGGSGALAEVEKKSVAIMRLPDEIAVLPHVRHAGTPKERVSRVTEVEYRVRWALTYLKKTGYVDNSQRGVWALTPSGSGASHVNEKEVVEKARAVDQAARDASPLAQEPPETASDAAENDIVESTWRDRLSEVLLAMEPAAFERLAQRVLREAGFEEVVVTGRSGDGGIDGRGIIRINDLVTLSAVFQCKRYQKPVGAGDVRDFRGGMAGKADRGIFITTSSFTSGASSEASRDGVTPIDLIDGDRLMDLLKRFELGVKTEMIESVEIDATWFTKI